MTWGSTTATANRGNVNSSGRFTSLEVCAGAGGLALGLERAGFDPVLLIESRPIACETLRSNRPHWDVRELDILDFDPAEDQQVYDIHLLSGGLPRVKSPAAVARTRGDDTELSVLKAAVDLVYGVQPRAILFENVSELITKSDYEPIRELIGEELGHLGYRVYWHVLNAKNFGVPQSREVGLLVAFKGDLIDRFEWPKPEAGSAPTVGETLRDSMGVRGWPDAAKWAAQADVIAPTIVGGSWDRGGADLGPTGAKQKWERMGVDGVTVADLVPDAAFSWNPASGRRGRVPLTVDQVALLQGFPPDWHIAGLKTARYRQVGNATPPPLAQALGESIAKVLRTGDDSTVRAPGG
ncbi:DNA cytosine methyltransferase [Streptomyces cahuitamycinicus]|uniref:DNA (cytosine-5-)-methyltransferase n=1 Tax=Streptomyces cahuitamycinicus TaxID=2070367 RepID=A0A2N8TSB5_9ACTN|nr:DNA cytosine methyltransferase [Streptomyces cahuitamycinicus]PNG21880.1 DNA cytosine methyltransferase [Streptomyces cahuitamycinicus]